MDGITGHTDEVAGKETKRSRLFPGTRIKFSQACEWEINDEVIDPAFRAILSDVARIVTRRGADWKPVEPPLELEPGEPWPDIEAWNEAIPRSEWIKGMNGSEGPWNKEQIVHLLNPTSMAQYHWVDYDTTGGGWAIRDIVGSIKKMRKFRPGAAPVVELSTTFMRTGYGGRQRPHFVVHGWITMPGEEPQPVALPAPSPTSASTTALEAADSNATRVIEAKAEPVKKPAKPIGTLDVAAPLTPVTPVTINEEMNDEIGF
jgi:hypothetical protein